MLKMQTLPHEGVPKKKVIAGIDFEGSKRAIIYVANDTKIPESVREYARRKRVETRRSFWRW